MTLRSDRLDPMAVLLMVALCALWGLNQVSIKVADGGISPVTQAGLRSAGAAILVWSLASWRGTPLFARDGTLWLGAVIALLFAGEFTFLNWSLEFAEASRVVVFLYLAPFVVALGGHRFIPGERLRPVHVAGLVCAFVGMALAFLDALRAPSPSELVGDVMAVAAAIFWGATTVVVKATRLARIAPHKVLFYQLSGSAVTLLALAAASGERGVFAPGPLVLASLLYQIAAIACVSYLAWFWLVTRYPAFKLAAFSFLTPLFGLVAGGMLLGETVTPALVFAVVLVGAGIYLVNRGPAKPTPDPTRAAAPLVMGD